MWLCAKALLVVAETELWPNVAVEPLLGGGDGDGPVVGDEDLEKDTRSRRRGSVLSDMLYGLINAIVGAPTMISFAAIIFSVSL